MSGSKVYTLETLLPAIEQHRNNGQTIVFANGCFDLLHVGHIRYLQGARALGDVLVVGLNGDNSVRMIKGAGRPLMPQEERAEILAAIQYVDYVVIFDETNVTRLLEQLRPHIHCKGTDYTEESVPEREVVRSFGGRVAIAGDPKNHSTRNMIEEILQKLGRASQGRPGRD